MKLVYIQCLSRISESYYLIRYLLIVVFNHLHPDIIQL